MLTSKSFLIAGGVFYWVTALAIFAQTGASSEATQLTSASKAQPTSTETLGDTFQQEQQALSFEQHQMVANGATPQQLQAWYQQNAPRLAAQQQRAQALAGASALSLQPTDRTPIIPTNASPSLRALLTAMASLSNARARIHNQLVRQLTASGVSPTLAQISQMQQNESQLFFQQNASSISSQMLRAKALTLESARYARTEAPQFAIPANATPQMAAYLTTRHQIKVALLQVANANASATPAVRQAALQAWYQQNASQFALLHQQAQALSDASSTVQNQ